MKFRIGLTFRFASELLFAFGKNKYQLGGKDKTLCHITTIGDR